MFFCFNKNDMIDFYKNNFITMDDGFILEWEDTEEQRVGAMRFYQWALDEIQNKFKKTKQKNKEQYLRYLVDNMEAILSHAAILNFQLDGFFKSIMKEKLLWDEEHRTSFEMILTEFLNNEQLVSFEDVIDAIFPDYNKLIEDEGLSRFDFLERQIDSYLRSKYSSTEIQAEKKVIFYRALNPDIMVILFEDGLGYSRIIRERSMLLSHKALINIKDMDNIRYQFFELLILSRDDIDDAGFLLSWLYSSLPKIHNSFKNNLRYKLNMMAMLNKSFSSVAFEFVYYEEEGLEEIKKIIPLLKAAQYNNNFKPIVALFEKAVSDANKQK